MNWDPAKHPRKPKGSAEGGQFAPGDSVMAPSGKVGTLGWVQNGVAYVNLGKGKVESALVQELRRSPSSSISKVAKKEQEVAYYFSNPHLAQRLFNPHRRRV